MASSSTLLQTSRDKSNQNIKSFLRVRPLNEREKAIRSHGVLQVQSNRHVAVKQENRLEKKFTFDHSFGEDSSQLDVYKEVVAPYITEVLAGYNCTVFAYGQTGTGKTHTMIGEEITNVPTSWEDNSGVGMIPRAVNHLFEELRLLEVEFSMRISFLELYNEDLFDLLSATDAMNIRIYDDNSKKGSVVVNGLEEIPVHNTADVYKHLAKGQEKRKTATTLMNAQSSRSHTIFSILVHIRENNVDGEEVLKVGKLNLVDLAGSENISKAGNEGKGQRTRETVNINQSLLTLGRVITALVERTPHIPYRESKLTRLLQESLGGRTKTSIIATVSPGHKDLEETLSTLEYAHRAKNIQNKPEVNQKLTKKLALKEYTEEIDRLKRDLMAARSKNGVYLAQETYDEITCRLDSQNRELNEKQSSIRMLKDEVDKIQKVFDEVSMCLVDKQTELTETYEKLQSTEDKLGHTTHELKNTRKKYREKKEILASHMHTEEVLTAQAVELRNVADIATNDTRLLHDAISRREMNDRSIEDACNKLKKTLHNNIDDMRSDFDNFSSNMEGQSKSVIKFMDVSIGQNIDLMEKLAKTVESILNEVISNEEFFKEKCVVSLGNVISELCSQLEQKDQAIMNLIEIQQSSISNFSSSQTLKFKKLSDNVTELLEQCRTTIDTSVIKNNDLLTNLSGYLKEWKENNELMNSVSPTISQSIAMIKKQTKDTIEETTLAKNENQNRCNQINNKVSTSSKEIVENFDDKVSSVIKLVDNNSNLVVTSLNSIKGELGKKVNKVTDDGRKMWTNFKSKIVGLAKSYQNEENVQEESLSGTLHKFNERLNTKLNEWKHAIDHFHENELKTYSITGSTPAKRDFNFPKVLAATSPHKRILNRFWAAHNESNLSLSETIMENNESTSNEPIEIQSSFVTQLTMPSRALNEIQVPVNISDIKIKIPLRNTGTSKFGLKTDNMPSEDTDKENS